MNIRTYWYEIFVIYFMHITLINTVLQFGVVMCDTLRGRTNIGPCGPRLRLRFLNDPICNL